MEQLVSIIVPIYKVEEYLPACVESILNQTHRALQIILVDDGSPDRCGELCDGYGRLDPRITVIHKENGGLSDARNAGMAIATGEFLMFVDSDDLLPADAVEVLLRLALEKDAPLVIGANARFENAPVMPDDSTFSSHVLSKTEAMEDMFYNGCAAWARLYRKELHEGILFPCGEINEDEAIVLHLLERCQQVVKTDKIVYHYRCREESITTTDFSQKKLAWTRHCKSNLEYVRKNHPELEAAAADRYLDSLQWSLHNIASSPQDFTDEARFLRQELRKERPVFRAVALPGWKTKFRVFMLTYAPLSLYRLLFCRH